MPSWDILWTDVNLATLDPGRGGVGSVPDGALAVRGDRIAWLGPARELPGPAAELAREVRSGHGGWMTPGLVDCHTHLVFAGHRADEFERRLGGATYEEIARRGGGIRSTVRATRAASGDALAAAAALRLRGWVAEGVTTVEIKSGYGLDTETELRMLRSARAAARELPLDVHTTFLGAHAVPPEMEGRRDAYVDLVVEEMLPRVVEEELAEAVDAFLEAIAFTPAQVERVLRAGAERGLALRLHADQLADGGGAALAARLGARSADHLEHASRAGVEAMAEAGTVAVLLPLAFYALGETVRPPVDAFREHGVPMAVASDANPGSAPARSFLLALNMACTLFRLTPAEALAGATRVAAGVLGLEADRGTLQVGKRADLALWDVGTPAELCYWIGGNPLRESVKDGRVVEGPG